ncbi:hypothetical protein BDQ12DRAFT_710873 [Crucibulum laeve]|uniref:Ser-Thr-rich glycosyl-phosphatidyl-inositol-anchored membrane family-domain-containing protein n=1 Tax=Crucibulum laeve TaxID=68775 RepID=A0A5C3MB56_9AGAR|nr:hypothetical protein BDQ12DRAFT_710873 [Crucibulum laeve]
MSFPSPIAPFRASIFCLLFTISLSTAQVPVNGQIFTNGLSIINAPALNTPFHAGSNIPISIEVSGNGKLPSPAVLPGSSLPTRYDELDIYLVSSQTSLNITVSSGPMLLTGETGSVRHLNWPIPACISKGQYNLTFYEASHFNSDAHFVITPIPISIENETTSQSCTSGVNDLESQPQTSSPLLQSPFLPGQDTSVQTAVASPALTVTLSGNDVWPPSVTATATTLVDSATVVIISVETVTTTGTDQNPSRFTTTKTSTTVMNTQDLAGFIPVNGSMPAASFTSVSVALFISLWSLLLVALYLI